MANTLIEQFSNLQLHKHSVIFLFEEKLQNFCACVCTKDVDLWVSHSL